MIDNVYVINLAKRPDRLKKITARLAALKLHCTRINAVECNTSLDAKVRAVAQSHLDAMNAAIAAGEKLVMICEDDALFTKDFAPRLEAALKWLNESQPTWTAFYGGVPWQGLPEIAPGIVRVRTSYWHCYVVNAAGLVAMRDAGLKRIADKDGVCWRIHDGANGRFAAYPPICVQEPDRSDVRPGSYHDHTPFFFPGSGACNKFKVEHQELRSL